MLKKIIKSYYKLLDEKLENWTVVVIVIAILIVWVSLIINDTKINSYSKSNILEVNKYTTYNNIYQNSILEINWLRYKIILEEITN